MRDVYLNLGHLYTFNVNKIHCTHVYAPIGRLHTVHLLILDEVIIDDFS